MYIYLNSSLFLYHSFSYACNHIGLLPSILCLLVLGTRPLRALRPRPSISDSPPTKKKLFNSFANQSKSKLKIPYAVAVAAFNFLW